MGNCGYFMLLIGAIITRFIAGFTGAQTLQQVETIQSLWPGYWENHAAVACALVTTSVFDISDFCGLMVGTKEIDGFFI